MRYYALGADPGIRTPGFVLAEMQTVKSLLDGLHTRALQLPADLQPRWKAFYENWIKFWNDNSSGFGGWWSRGTTPVYNKTVEFRDLGIDWRKVFEQYTGSFGDPSPGKKGAGWSWKTYAAIGGIAAAGIGVWYLTRD